MKFREVTRDLEAHGWRVHRQRGSHRVVRHRDYPDRRVVVAGNEGSDEHNGTLGSDTPPGRVRPAGPAMRRV
jgi:predicted RNA binding protein YcfA (HicA-like mRNA interferase family)